MPARKSDVPLEALWHFFEHVSLPLAIVLPDNRYCWCNAAYERLIGYSLTQLQKLTWMDITISEDVPGDLASVMELREGRRESYQMEKRYRHASGVEVPVKLKVLRYPRSGGEMQYMMAEAAEHHMTREEVLAIQSLFERRVDKLERLYSRMARKHREDPDSSSQVVNVGNNSTEIFRWIVIALLALIAGITWWSFYVGGGKEPPRLPAMEIQGNAGE